MSNTPNLALPYPELSDTADVPRDIKALAVKLDTILGGGGGGGGTGTLPLANAPVLDVGRVGQVRAGHELAVADFTSLGLGTPAGLFNLSGLANLGSGGALVNLGAVPFGIGINGLATTAAVFAGSTGQALYIADTGAADPFRLRTGSWGCWFRTAKRGVVQDLVSRASPAAANGTVRLVIIGTNIVQAGVAFTAAAFSTGSTSDREYAAGITDVCDDRWHFAAGTFDGSVVRLYLDGVLEAQTATVGQAIASNAAPLNIGAMGGDGSTAPASPSYGRVDEAFVTADVLTEDQVRLLYASKLAHALAVIPTSTRLSIHRRRKGAALAVADFPAQPVRLHNFTGGALTDQGTGGVALTVAGNPPVSVAGPDGTPGGAQSLSSGGRFNATDAGLPGGVTARSYGCWFKSTAAAVQYIMAWGATNATNDARLGITGGPSSGIFSGSGSDTITGPFVADGQWHLVVSVEDNAAGDGVRRKLYLDGRLVGASTVLNAITLGGANKFVVGADLGGSNALVGQIDAAFVSAVALTIGDVQALYAKGVQDLGASPKNAGDHVERMDATTVLFVGDTLESQHTVDLGVVA